MVRECIFDNMGCNIIAISYGLVKLLRLELVLATDMMVSIADGSIYNSLGLVDVNIVVVDTKP